MTNLVPPTPNELQVYYQEDEINLIDIFLVLLKRKNVVFLVAAMCIIAGVIFSIIKPKVYTYSTSIEIGAIANIDINKDTGEITSGELKLVDDPNSVLAKINESYFPVVLQEYVKNNPDVGAFEVKARSPKGSEIIVLESKGKESAKDVHVEVHNRILDRLIQGHKKRTNVVKNQYLALLNKNKLKLEELQDPTTVEVERKALQNEQIRAELKLEELKDPKILAVPQKGLEREISLSMLKLQELKDQQKLTKEQLKRQVEVQRLLQKQATNLNEQINTVLQRRNDALKEVKDEAKAMTMLLIDSEIQQNRDRLANIEERLYVSLKNERGELDKSLADIKREQEIQVKEILNIEGKLEKLSLDNRRDQERQAPFIAELEAQLKKLESDHLRNIARQKQKLSELESILSNVRETTAVIPPMQSLKPVGTGKSLIIIVSIIMGLIFGIIAAFMFEFIDKAKTRLQEQS